MKHTLETSRFYQQGHPLGCWSLWRLKKCKDVNVHIISDRKAKFRITKKRKHKQKPWWMSTIRGKLMMEAINVQYKRVKERERERELRMEKEFQGRPAELQLQCCSARMMSPEIVEIGEESKSIINSRDAGANDVYVAVGKDDIDVLKWALDHAVSPGCCVFLVHVFPPLTYIPTPVGRLARSQLSQEQLRVYINEENNKRRNLLQKYIRLCTDAKVTVDTLLLESNTTAKAILQLIPVLNITNLVIGTKKPLSTRVMGKRMVKGELVKKNAPDFCEVTIVYEGKKVDGRQQEMGLAPSSQDANSRRRRSGKNLLECVCLSSRSHCD